MGISTPWGFGDLAMRIAAAVIERVEAQVGAIVTSTRTAEDRLNTLLAERARLFDAYRSRSAILERRIWQAEQELARERGENLVRSRRNVFDLELARQRLTQRRPKPPDPQDQ